MTYLLDANCLIDSNRDFYPLDRVPEFWDWLQHKGENEILKVPEEILAEVKAGNDALAAWVKKRDITKAIALERELTTDVVAKVLDEAYGENLTEVEIETIGADAFLVAHAITDLKSSVIVTREASKPSAKRQNRKVPDVCKTFGIRCISLFELIRAEDFRTNWKTR